MTSESQIEIRATVSVREGLQLDPPKAFANGLVAGNRRVVGQQAVRGGREWTYAWDARLPSEPRVLIQVVAATDAEAAEIQSVTIERRDVPPRPTRRLYLLAVGVNHYRDAQIQRLEYAVNNVRRLTDLLRRGSGGLYSSDAVLLLDDRATRSLWTVVTRQYAERLRREVHPDDLVVFCLSGHGVRDPVTEKYYFVAADAKFADVKAGRFSDCLSFDDFGVFADVPCRKLVILDTCHSGAIQQPLRQQDLKAAVRALQNDVVFTMTASDGGQEAVEQRDRQLGRFTSHLLEALEGAADTGSRSGNSDGVVTLNEAIRYVTETVRSESSRDPDGTLQSPTASPLDLLDYVSLPLTRISPQTTVGPRPSSE